MNKFIFHLTHKDNQAREWVPAYMFRGVFMDMLSRVDPKFITELHEPNKMRPYAISIKRMNDSLLFIVNILKENISKAILDFIISTSNFELKVKNTEYILVKVDFETIKLENFIKNAKIPIKFQLKFLTPAYFNIIGRDFVLRFPEPTFLFENLARTWNAFAPAGCQVDFTELYEWISKQVFVSSYDLRTKPYNIGKKNPVVGCVGWVNYIIKNPEKGYSSWLDILLKFAEYANIGGNRTAACGVVVYRPLETLEPKNKTQ
ncbi:MAG: CRISPR system precrRNA processing endoribonuclease RAMP protein Cas6 [Candidatus Helarchaeota archaeon]